MTDLEALAAFRAEIQVDRIEIQRTIAAGFKQLNDKFDEHAKSDTDNFDEINNRLTAIETKAGTIGKIVWTLTVTFIASTLNWFFNIIKHL